MTFLRSSCKSSQSLFCTHARVLLQIVLCVHFDLQLFPLNVTGKHIFMLPATWLLSEACILIYLDVSYYWILLNIQFKLFPIFCCCSHTTTRWCAALKKMSLVSLACCHALWSRENTGFKYIFKVHEANKHLPLIRGWRPYSSHKGLQRDALRGHAAWCVTGPHSPARQLTRCGPTTEQQVSRSLTWKTKPYLSIHHCAWPSPLLLKPGSCHRANFCTLLPATVGTPKTQSVRHLWNDPIDSPSSHCAPVSLLLFKQVVLLAKI